MKELSTRTAGFTDSVIRRMTRVANEYGAINLSQGFPDFEPPKEITDPVSAGSIRGTSPVCNHIRGTEFQRGISKKTGAFFRHEG